MLRLKGGVALLLCLLYCASVYSLEGSVKSQMSLKNTDFEIHGKVQGVSFRVNTAKKATELGLVGWVMNTKTKTVVGQAQGSMERVDALKHWLEHVGSPKSRIDHAQFSNEHDLTELEFDGFKVRK